LALGFRVEADVADDRLAQQLGSDELADSLPRCRSVIGDHREIAFVLPHDLVDDPLGRADGHEAADHQARAIGNHGDRLLKRDRLHVAPVFLASGRSPPAESHAQLHFNVMPTSPGIPPGKSTISNRNLYPRGFKCSSQNRNSSSGSPVSVFSQPGSCWLMARPRSVKSWFGKRPTSTSVRPLSTARLMIAAARLIRSSLETPDGLTKRSSSAFFSASACARRRISLEASSASTAAIFFMQSFAEGRSSS